MARKNGTAPAEPPPARRVLKPLAVKIDAELIEEARSAAAYLGGMPHQMTLSRIVADALRPHLELLRRRHNRGRPFGPAPHRLRQGRPLKIHSSDSE
jgi:uncharacterized protein (DUF2236 family)